MLQPSQDKSKILYDAVSKDYDIGTYEEFSAKLQNPEKRKSFYEGVGQEYALGTYEDFESKITPLKKKDKSDVTAQDPKLVSETSTGSLDGVGSNGFPAIDKNLGVPGLKPDLKTVDQLANPPKSKATIQEKTTNKEDVKGFGEGLLNRLDTGIATFSKSFYDAPKMILDAVYAPQNYLSEKLNIPSLKVDPETYAFENIPSKNMDEIVNSNNKKIENYKKEIGGDVVSTFDKGDYVNTFKHAALNSMESAPLIAAAMVTGGESLLANSLMIGSSASTQYDQLNKEHPEMGTGTKLANAAVNGALEVAVGKFMEGVGGNVWKNVLAKKGVKETAQIATNSFKKTLEKVVGDSPMVGVAGEYAEERITDGLQQLNDIATGASSDFNWDQNKNAGLSSLGFGLPNATALYSAKAYISNKTRKRVTETSKQIVKLQNDLQNPELSPENKKIISENISKIYDENKKILGDELEKLKIIPEKTKGELLSIDKNIDKIKDNAIDIKYDVNISEENKTLLLKKLEQDFKDNINRKNEILSKTSEVEFLPLKEQDKLKRQALKELTAELNPDGKKNIEIDNAQIVERANKIYKAEQENLIKEKDAKVEIPITETKPQAEVPQQAEAEKVEKTKYRIAELNNELEQNRIRGEKGEISNRSNKEIKAEIAELESKLPKEEVVPTQESNVPVSETKEAQPIEPTKVEELRDSTEISKNQEVPPVVEQTTPDTKEPASEDSPVPSVSDIKERVVYDREPTADDGVYKIIGDQNNIIYRVNPNTGRIQEFSDGFWSNTASNAIARGTARKEGFQKIKDPSINNESTSPTNNPANGNLSIGTSDVGESGIIEQQSSPKESVPSAVDVGKSEIANEVDYALNQIDKGILLWNGDIASPRIDLGISWADIRKGEADLKRGKVDSVPAKRLIEAIGKSKADGGYRYKLGTGGANMRSGEFVTFEDLQRANNEIPLTDAELEEVNREQEQLAKEQIEILENYENRIDNQGKVSENTEIGKSKNDVSNEKTPSRKEKRIKAVEASIDDLANALKDLLPSAPDTEGLRKQGLSQDDLIDFIAKNAKLLASATITIDEAIRQVIEHLKSKGFDLDVDENLVKEKLGVEKSIAKDELSDFRDLIRDIPQKDEVKNYLSGETIERIHGETRNDQSYNAVSLADLALHGKLVMDKAKELFGDQYVEKTLDFLESANLEADEKAIQYVALENEMDNRVSENPNDLGERKLQDLVREKSQAHLRKSAIAINAGRLRAIMKYGIDVNKYPDEILTSKQKQAKNEIEKLVQHTSEDINNEAELQEQGDEKLYTQEDFDRELQKAKDEFDSDYNISVFENLKRQAKKDKLSEKKEDLKSAKAKVLEDIRKVVRESMGQTSINPIAKPIEFANLVTKLAKIHIQEGALSLEEVANNIYNDLKDMSKDISKESILNILKSKPKRVMSEATKRKIYIALLNKNIEYLDAQIQAKKRDVITRVDKYKNDAEIKDLRDKRNKKRDELAKVDPSYAESRKLATDLKLAQKSLEEYQRKINESDFSPKERAENKVDEKLQALREKRDAKRKEYEKAKKEYSDSKKEPKKVKTAEEINEEKINSRIKATEQQIYDLENDIKRDVNGKNSVWSKELSEAKNKLKELRDSKKESKPKDKKIQEIVKQALIDAGFSRKVNIKGEEKTLLDWKKLAGEESSIPKLKANVETSLKKQGYTNSQIKEIGKSLEDEYIRLGSDIIEKGLRELESRNKVKPTPTRKTDAKRLSELYNYGLFNGEKATEYDNLLNKTLGLSEFDVETYQKIKSLSKALASVYNQENNGRKLSEIAVQTLNSTINNQIKSLLATSALKSGTKAFNVASAFDDYVGLSMRALLGSVSTLAENKISGEFQVQLQKAFSSGKITPELKKQIEADKKAVFRDITRNAGLFYGDTNTSLTHNSRFEEWLNGKADKAMAHTVVSSFLLRAFLDGVDSSVKVRLTQKAFVKNVIKLLTSESNPNGKMSAEEAIKYVSEQLTGENFKKALETAKSIIEDVNKEQGKKVIKDTDEAIHRFAMDLVKENLLSSDMLTMDNIESAYKSAYKSAGRSIGHEANNIISAGVNLLSSTLNKRLEKAIQEKNYALATSLTLLSTIQKSIINPFVGGGTNWVILGLEKSGNPLGYISVIHNATERKKLDLSENKSDITQSLYRDSVYKDSAVRLLVGTGLAMAMFAVLTAGDDDEELLGKLNQWLKDNPWAKKHFNKLAPEAVTFLIDMKNGELSKHWQKILGMKNDYFDNIKTLINTFSDENSSMSGAFGAFVGQNLSSPGPWKTIKDVVDILRGIKGVPPVKTDYKTNGFWNGYFRAGLVDFMKLRPGVNYDLNSKIDKVKDDAKKLNSEIDSFVKEIYDKKLSDSEINKKINELFDKEPLKKEKILNAVKNRSEEEKLKRSGVDPFYIKLKREPNDEIKAILFQDRFNDVSKLSPAERDEIVKGMNAIKFTGGTEFWVAYWRLSKPEMFKNNKPVN